MNWASALHTVARYSTPVLSVVVETFVPGAKPVLDAVKEVREQFEKSRDRADKEEMQQALQLSGERIDALERLFALLASDCRPLLDRVAEATAQGGNAADLVLAAALEQPDLQARFDAIGRDLADRVSELTAEVRRLDEQYASLAAYAAESRRGQLSDTELADFRAFHRAKQFQLAGRFSESEPILLKLAGDHPTSAAVAVALAVARHDDPQEFSDELKRARRLRPNDANLRALATAATVAVTGRETPAVRPRRFAPPADHRDPQVGDTVDGWLLEEKIGGGGWGLVFRATKKGQTRAVKVMRRKLVGNADFLEAFNDEVFKLVEIPRHRNVVKVERNGTCLQFGCPYFVMPLLPGPNLEQHLDRHGVPMPDVAMGWLNGLLDALDHVHTHGLIHRDVKPQNVIILADGTPVLIDFGIAGLASVAEDYTQAIGKSSFFAPPELQNLGVVDVRSDLYMLAATLFYALRYDHPLMERAAFQFTPELVPEEFAVAFEAAVSPKPSKRPASVLEFRGLLDINAAEVEIRKKKRAKAEAIRLAQIEKAQQDAERELKIKEAEDAERIRVAEEARQRERHAEVCRLNLARWTETDAPERWVTERLPSWDDAGWKQLLHELEHDGRYWPMDPAEVGKHVEAIRDGLNEERRKREEEVRQAKIKAEREAKRKTEPWRFPGEKPGDQITITLPAGVPMKFAWCPPGSFMMGSNIGNEGEKPVHPVRLTKGFWVGVHPVTQGQWKAVMSDNPSHFTDDFQLKETVRRQRSWWGRLRGEPETEERLIGNPISADLRPVECVSWEMAKRFCDTVRERLNIPCRLPTEAEWEYACRGGTTTDYYWGNVLDGTQANCLEASIRQTTPVGHYSATFPHPWGLTDVHGNVWEWCADWYDAGFYVRSPQTDPECRDSEQKYRVLRGGSFSYTHSLCHAACREVSDSSGSYGNYGLRVVFSPD